MHDFQMFSDQENVFKDNCFVFLTFENYKAKVSQ